ncbi:MAG: response regulator [Rhodospirillales bacterium]|nr:response regulator [Rhodospirillales bacterium]
MPNVLLIDDDALARSVVRTLLEDLACDVTEAEDGVVASSKMEGREFDLIVTDIFMPNQDGIETIRKIRRARNDVCIVAISANDAINEVNYLKMAERIGADYSLCKPLKSEQLKGIIGNLKVSA